jgi:aspartyl-tRNA(Asn)/glutamyl-tRNA(Gln) amidotransferase subunit C
MSRKITAEDVRKIARLSRLAITDAEADIYADQLAHILAHMDSLAQLDTTTIPPKVHAIDLHNILRDDAIAPSLPHDLALREAPAHDGQFFLVPKVFET